MNVQFHCRALAAFRFTLRVALIVGACATGPFARAATICIQDGDAVGLQSALALTAGNGEDDLIELQSGSYSMPATFQLVYNAVSEHHDLTIEGGYSANFGDECGTPPQSPDARMTVLKGGLWQMHLAAGAGSVKLQALTLTNTFDTNASRAPITFGADANSTGDIIVENTVFHGNSSSGTSAIYLIAAQGNVFVRNSVFASNTTFAPVSAIRIGSQRNSSFCTTIVNATFANNTSTVPSVGVYSPNCLATAGNDIFWNNVPGGDVVFEHPSNAFVTSVDLMDVSEVANTHTDGVVSINPYFNPDFSLTDFSPLRDRGTGGPQIVPGDFDVSGNPRAYHDEWPDMGAFEIQDVIFASDFDVDFSPFF